MVKGKMQDITKQISELETENIILKNTNDDLRLELKEIESRRNERYKKWLLW